ncbi:MAG: bifunctional phosphoribosyl-AMP cyclohydrolase/phosphoribosyl-ATP diphosphatase HisIE [Candidatus Peribacteraceae bacterium]|nr:bifunctional phosphoribosyl-AMP cyclohydrolase/phosphoribosyl-ATP diphosphatase HisIE [Candidatus Peribacteraceae bacterium]MDD5074951.1 bifunctional phosphoribosyl-AMP cyclohydrolase/phosphoribosyl-ATP diphosphatase HisIE [Candidatus Peribacteraceae bacterium]
MTSPLSMPLWQNNPDTLLPAIVQDQNTGQVLMLGNMNEEAFMRMQKTGKVTFFSRSRQRLWEKGETSGNTLRFISASVDCDGDALLIRAIPVGPTCHTGDRSCFSAEETAPETIGNLAATIRRRAETGSSVSYTKQLLTGGVAFYGAKVLEEAEEVVRAAKQEGKRRTIEEAADLLYHLLVLLEGEGISLDEIAGELRKRRR